jgi:hypothetical protein
LVQDARKQKTQAQAIGPAFPIRRPHRPAQVNILQAIGLQQLPAARKPGSCYAVIRAGKMFVTGLFCPSVELS